MENDCFHDRGVYSVFRKQEVYMSKFAPINKGILGTKLGMGQFFEADGTVRPVTIVKVGPCHVIQKKSSEKDGYKSIQISYGDKKEKRTKKPEIGHYAKSGQKPGQHLKEFRFCDEVYNSLNVGDSLTIEQFKNGDYLDICSISKGKGFAGVMKRYGFRGRPATHGTHESFRGPGSIGACQTPGRVYKGRKMPGQMGNKKITVQNLRIVKIDNEKNLLFILGAVPGATNSLITIRDSVKNPSYPFYVKNEE
jgi:large subunit ribosomal protein L3